MTQGRLAQLRRLIGDAVGESDEEPAPSMEMQQQRAFQLYEFNVTHPVLDQSPRSRAIREISRIAGQYGWGDEIARVLDAAGASSLPDLDDYPLSWLLERMRQLQECRHNGGYSPDEPPAY